MKKETGRIEAFSDGVFANWLHHHSVFQHIARVYTSRRWSRC